MNKVTIYTSNRSRVNSTIETPFGKVEFGIKNTAEVDEDIVEAILERDPSLSLEPIEEVKERVKILTDLSKYFSLEFAKRFIGKPQEVLIESQRDRSTGLLTGYTDRYVRVLTDGPDLFKNCLVSVRSRPPCLLTQYNNVRF